MSSVLVLAPYVPHPLTHGGSIRTPGSLVVNIGDMLQRLTNDVLPSTTHRVVNPKPERNRFSSNPSYRAWS